MHQSLRACTVLNGAAVGTLALDTEAGFLLLLFTLGLLSTAPATPLGATGVRTPVIPEFLLTGLPLSLGPRFT